MFISSREVSRVPVHTPLGTTSERRGTSRTSSNVRASPRSLLVRGWEPWPGPEASGRELDGTANVSIGRLEQKYAELGMPACELPLSRKNPGPWGQMPPQARAARRRRRSHAIGGSGGQLDQGEEMPPKEPPSVLFRHLANSAEGPKPQGRWRNSLGSGGPALSCQPGNSFTPSASMEVHNAVLGRCHPPLVRNCS